MEQKNLQKKFIRRPNRFLGGNNMGTRGICGFKYKNKYYCSYVQFDTYPSGLGTEIVSLCEKINNENGWDKLKESVSKLRLVEAGDIVVQAKERKKYSAFIENPNDLKEKEMSWYWLLRKAQGVDGLEAIYKKGLDVIIDSFTFLADSLFCEYAYIIDLDTNRLRFYKGFNNSPTPKTGPEKTLWTALELMGCDIERDNIEGNSPYYPVRAVGSPKLSAIPKNWAKKYYGKNA